MNNTVKVSLRPYSIKEEIWNCIIHGTGIALSIAGLTILVVLSSIYGNVWAIVSTAVFGVSMILLYTASTLYHAIPNPEIKKKLKKLDHISIFYLIAGTYTPFLLVNMRGTLGWTVFGIIWGLALTGTVLKLRFSGSGTKLWSIGLYLIMGWMIVIASEQLFTSLPRTGLLFLICGWFVLYSGRFVLHLEKQTIYPRHLALFCSKRYDNAFLCRALQLCSAVEKLILFWGGFVLARRQTPERRQDIKKSNDNQH